LTLKFQSLTRYNVRMEKATTPGARAVKAFRDRKREAGEVELRGLWVPAELAEQARKAVAELAEQHKATK